MATSQMNKLANYLFDGAPYAMKVACTVRTGGKDGDNLKILPISIT